MVVDDGCWKFRGSWCGLSRGSGGESNVLHIDPIRNRHFFTLHHACVGDLGPWRFRTTGFGKLDDLCLGAYIDVPSEFLVMQKRTFQARSCGAHDKVAYLEVLYR